MYGIQNGYPIKTQKQQKTKMLRYLKNLLSFLMEFQKHFKTTKTFLITRYLTQTEKLSWMVLENQLVSTDCLSTIKALAEVKVGLVYKRFLAL